MLARLGCSDFLFWRFYSVVARKRRKKGCYNHRTLKYFICAYKLNPSANNLLGYLRFRRDLGYRPATKYLKKLSEYPDKSLTGRHRFLVNSLSESSVLTTQLNVFSGLDLEVLSEHSPSAALELNRRGGVLTGTARLLAEMQREQKKWYSSFSEYLRQHSVSICVVGNSSVIEGRKQGKAIDAHSIVFRFNQFAGSELIKPLTTEDGSSHTVLDVGRQVDIWCMAPDLQPPYPELGENSKWVVLSGPDVRYQLADWSSVVPMLEDGCKIIAVPLRIWRSLVRELKAPPSAGVLCLAWVIDILGGRPEGLSATGFQRSAQSVGRYHYSLVEKKPGNRHNWKGEQGLLLRWESKGLRFLS